MGILVLLEKGALHLHMWIYLLVYKHLIKQGVIRVFKLE